MIQLQEHRKPHPFSLFNLGFRPFFLGGALAAALLLVSWLVIFSKGAAIHYYGSGILWHSHEMLFGFSLAIIAGFLLTAVRNWTNVQTLYGWPLAALFLLWVAARLMPFVTSLPEHLIAFTDLAFAPMLAVSIAIPIIRSKNYRNLVFAPLLLGFFIANLLVHLELLGMTEATAGKGIQLGLFLVIVIISIIGGRVIPFFTERGVEGVSCKRYEKLEKAIIPLSIIWLLLSLLPFTTALAVFSLVLGLANLVRCFGWFNRAILAVPLVWILQLGYLFVPLGLILFGLSQLELLSQSAAFHALAVGAIGNLTLGMMSRVSLGHSGRPLAVNRVIVFAFALMLFAAVLRTSIDLLPIPYMAVIHLSGALWVLAWLLFLVKYTAMLIKPRLDGVYG